VTEPLLSCRDLVVQYQTSHGVLRAVDGVDLEIGAGQTVALVGESGCGKSTLGRAIVGLTKPHRGSIRLEGIELFGMSRRAIRPYRRSLQMVFQNPYGSLNPRLTIGRIIEEPLIVQKIGTRPERQRRVAELLERVGLSQAAMSQYPHEFSGGQRQRIAIARALTLNPKLIICDEPVSALDVSVQAQVLNLMVDLQRDLGLSYLFISHDLSVVRHIAHSTVVMYLGRIVAKGDRRGFWKQPLHPYVKALLDAAPSMQKGDDPDRSPALESEIPSALTPPPGCRFSTRCAFVQDQCRLVDPPLRELTPQQWVACHRVTTTPDGRALAPWEHIVTPAPRTS
jgi:oligopeptide/dipeptide ABC transporter ATP-binding protein